MTRKEISELLVSWGMPTRQAFILELVRRIEAEKSEARQAAEAQMAREISRALRKIDDHENELVTARLLTKYIVELEAKPCPCNCHPSISNPAPNLDNPNRAMACEHCEKLLERSRNDL